MKIILSRKGFDSTAGGCPSPIFADGQLLSLPIPHKRSPIRYCDIECNGRHLGKLVSDLTGNRIRPDFRAHLDPDVRRGSIARSADWQPLFGQCGAAQGHLRNHGVGQGDLFLFFGLFRRVIARGDGFAWDPSSRPVHLIWGWFQIGQLLVLNRSSCAPSWAQYHPHCGLCDEPNNTLYIASPHLEVRGTPATALLGAGVFPRYSSGLQLTDPGADRHVTWRLPRWIFPNAGRPPLTFHSNMQRWSQSGNATLLCSVDRGQEYILDADQYPEAPGWSAALIQSHAPSPRKPAGCSVPTT